MKRGSLNTYGSNKKQKFNERWLEEFNTLVRESGLEEEFGDDDTQNILRSASLREYYEELASGIPAEIIVPEKVQYFFIKLCSHAEMLEYDKELLFKLLLEKDIFKCSDSESAQRLMDLSLYLPNKSFHNLFEALKSQKHEVSKPHRTISNSIDVGAPLKKDDYDLYEEFVKRIEEAVGSSKISEPWTLQVGLPVRFPYSEDYYAVNMLREDVKHSQSQKESFGTPGTPEAPRAIKSTVQKILESGRSSSYESVVKKDNNSPRVI